MTPRYLLGRRVEVDERSRAYAIEAHPAAASLRKTSTLWQRYSPILDQGSVGSCTGNAMAGALGCWPFSRTSGDAERWTEVAAVDLYARATRLDPYPGAYPPDDTGSSGLAVAKAARQLGAIKGWRHAYTLDALLHALQSGPLIVGAPWHADMFTPAADGSVAPAGPIEGGHEWLVRGWDADKQALRCDNSWSASWGPLGGSFLVPGIAWDQLLREGADAIAPHL